MTQYRLFYFDGFVLTGSDVIEAADGADAVLAALVRAEGRGFELWRGGARLHAFPPADSYLEARAEAEGPRPSVPVPA